MNITQHIELLSLLSSFDKKVSLSKKKNQINDNFSKANNNLRFQKLLDEAENAVNQLKDVVNSDNWEFLPFALPRLNLLDDEVLKFNRNRPQNITQLTKYIMDAIDEIDFQNIFTCTRLLIIYETMFCSEATSSKKDLEAQTNSIANIQRKTKNLYTTASAELEQIQKIKQQIIVDMESAANAEQQTKNMSNTASKNVAEIQMMINQLDMQRKSLEELKDSVLVKVNDAENKNTQLAESVARIQDDGDRLLKEISQKTKQVSEQIENIETLIESANSKVMEVNQKSKEGLEEVEKNLDETKKNVNHIKKMMSYIADGTLGHSFNERKQVIDNKVKIWMRVSIFAFIFALVWIFIVFKFLSAETDIVWANILINAVKSSLAVFAFGYALNEYGKERNLQEEYAFRETIALTLSAYLDKLETCDKDEMKKLLVDTVEKLYTKPVISNKEYKFMKKNAEEIANDLKPIIDIIKPVVDKD